MWSKLLLLFVMLGCAPLDTHEKTPATVTRILSGNTIEVQTANGKTLVVRVLGISAPKSEHDATRITSPETPPVDVEMAQRANDFAKEQLLDKRIILISPTVSFKEDRFGRTLAFVMVKKNDYSEMVAREGLAWVYSPTFKPNFMTQRSHIYQQAEAEARQAKRGIWADDENE